MCDMGKMEAGHQLQLFNTGGVIHRKHAMNPGRASLHIAAAIPANRPKRSHEKALGEPCDP